jgi:nucleoside-diphosphate-sugar epimerase
MSRGRAATTFVTGAAVFIDSELVRVLIADGYQVVALCPTLEMACHVKRIGAASVVGDVLEPGQWQDEAAADCVFYFPDSFASERAYGMHR